MRHLESAHWLEAPRWPVADLAWDGEPRLDAWLSQANAHRRGPRDVTLRHGRVLSFTALAILGGFYK